MVDDEREIEVEENERQREVVSVFPKPCSSQTWARLKPGGSRSTQVFLLGGQKPTTGAPICCLPGSHWQGQVGGKVARLASDRGYGKCLPQCKIKNFPLNTV